MSASCDFAPLLLRSLGDCDLGGYLAPLLQTRDAMDQLGPDHIATARTWRNHQRTAKYPFGIQGQP